jgi:hypothetical protein
LRADLALIWSKQNSTTTCCSRAPIPRPMLSAPHACGDEIGETSSSRRRAHSFSSLPRLSPCLPRIPRPRPPAPHSRPPCRTPCGRTRARQQLRYLALQTLLRAGDAAVGHCVTHCPHRLIVTHRGAHRLILTPSAASPPHRSGRVVLLRVFKRSIDVVELSTSGCVVAPAWHMRARAYTGTQSTLRKPSLLPRARP